MLHLKASFHLHFQCEVLDTMLLHRLLQLSPLQIVVLNHRCIRPNHPMRRRSPRMLQKNSFAVQLKATEKLYNNQCND